MVTMGEVATITSKKMVTIPAKIMKRYGLSQGQKVSFVEVDGAIMLVPVLSLKELHGFGKEHAKELIEAVRELGREHREEARKDGQNSRP
jgi:AbrB family looped-hinge helix DNA binding protein